MIDNLYTNNLVRFRSVSLLIPALFGEIFRYLKSFVWRRLPAGEELGSI